MRKQTIYGAVCLMIAIFCLFMTTTRNGNHPTKVYMVDDEPGYNCWPMIQSVGNRLVCVYTKGKYHDTAEKGRGAYFRYSDDGAKTWSDNILIDVSDHYGTSSIGKGTDLNEHALFWIRRMNDSLRMALYRTEDGTSMELISTLSLNPLPMQITDIYHTPRGLECLWFSDDYSELRNNKSWGLLYSKDNGKTWTQEIIEHDLAKADWPTEPSVVVLGDGRLLAVTRCEAGLGNQFQLTSEDWGKTWKKERTNINDVKESTPSLIYDKSTDQIFNYYYQRGAGLLKRRVAKAADIFSHPTAWPEPEVIAEGGKQRPYDSGNANALKMGEKHFITYYTGDSINCKVVVAVQTE